MTEVAIYGGSFDPVHYGHIFTVAYLASLGKFDTVCMIPVGKHAYGKQLTEHFHRYEMCRLGTEWIQKSQVLDIEKQILDLPDHPDVNYTYYTLKRIKELHPDWNLHFVVGADVANQIQDWELGEELLSIAKPYTIGRHGYEHHGIAVLPDISSTEVRGSLKKDANHEIAKTFLPKPVYDYIINNELYQNPPKDK